MFKNISILNKIKQKLSFQLNFYPIKFFNLNFSQFSTTNDINNQNNLNNLSNKTNVLKTYL
jgi:hypothetical protein